MLLAGRTMGGTAADGVLAVDGSRTQLVERPRLCLPRARATCPGGGRKDEFSRLPGDDFLMHLPRSRARRSGDEPITAGEQGLTGTADETAYRLSATRLAHRPRRWRTNWPGRTTELWVSVDPTPTAAAKADRGGDLRHPASTDDAHAPGERIKEVLTGRVTTSSSPLADRSLRRARRSRRR